MIKKIILALSATFVMSQASAAVKVGPIDYAEKMSIGGQTLVLNGAGLRKILFFQVYAAGLYLPKAAVTTKDVLEQKGSALVRLALLRDVKTADFVESLQEGLNDNTSEEERKALDAEIKALVAVMKKIGDVKKGDIVEFEYTTKKETTVRLNGRTIGEKLGARPLYEAVLRIWVGDHCIDSVLKTSLLKAQDSD